MVDYLCQVKFFLVSVGGVINIYQYFQGYVQFISQFANEVVGGIDAAGFQSLYGVACFAY